MDELTRFARQLVERLATRPEGPNRPVAVGEIRRTVLPYRAQRRALGLASVEDYETVLLRLVSEERGYVRTAPPATAKRCREELAQPNPDLGLLDEIADSTIQVTSLAAGQVMADEPPPQPEPEIRSPQQDEIVLEPTMPEDSATRTRETSPAPTALCPHCHTPTPSGRTVVFCPWCGERLIPLTCTRCSTELDPEWRHCITCGLPVQDPFRST